MFLEIRKIRGNRKYYLVHSYRIAQVTKKIRAYLGMNLDKDELERKKSLAKERINLQIKALKELRDPYKTVLSGSELEGIKKLEPVRKNKTFTSK